MILLKRTVEIWNIILAYSWRQPNRNFYISPETSAVPINLTLRNSFLIMHLIIFIHLTALYCRLPSASSAPNKHVEAHPFSIPFQSFHSTSTFLSTKTPVSAENRKSMFQRLPFCFFNSARASSQEANPKNYRWFGGNCICHVEHVKICCNKHIQDQRNLRICMVQYHLRYGW